MRKKAEQCLQGIELVKVGNGDSLFPVLTEQEPAKRFRVSVYFLLRPGRKKLFL